MTSAWTKFCSALRTFSAARGGNVALLFALATIPIILGIGFAVDYSRANSVKTALQASLDSTALMMSQKAAQYTPDQLQQNALSYFKALFNSKFSKSVGGQGDASGVSLTATYSSSSGTEVVLTGAATVPTTFLGLIPGNTCGCLNVTTSSTVKWGSSRLRVALVLDNTGSMADAGKITALKTATANLLTQLKNAASADGDVYVSIIPFVKDVNLGASNWNSDYIYWGTAQADNNANNPSDPIQDSTTSDNTSWNANNGQCKDTSGNNSSSKPRSTCVSHGVCSLSGYNSQSSCTGAGTCSLSGYSSQSSCTSNGVCSNSQYTRQSRCQNNGATWTAGVWTLSGATWTAYTWVPYAHNDSSHGWNGCVMDRGYPTSPSTLGGLSGPDTTYGYDTNADAPDLTTPRMSSLYPAEQYSLCPQAAVMGLSYDWTTMNQLVSNMSPNGNTNQAIGLQLGWMSLVGGGPFTAPAMDPNYTYTQVIILLTDGLNTQNRWTTSQSSIDTRQQLTCDNINAAKITLYTIQVNTDGEPTSTLLQNCAGSPGKYPDSDKFFLLTSADQIVTTFNQIGTKLSSLYVAK